MEYIYKENKNYYEESKFDSDIISNDGTISELESCDSYNELEEEQNLQNEIDISKLCPSLAKCIDPNYKLKEEYQEKINKIDWMPPKQPGLNNSLPIINLNKKDDIINNIINNIRNYKKLNMHLLEYITNLEKKDLIKIINEYNNLLNN